MAGAKARDQYCGGCGASEPVADSRAEPKSEIHQSWDTAPFREASGVRSVFQAMPGVTPVTAALRRVGRPYFGFLKKTPRLTTWEIVGNTFRSAGPVWIRQGRATGGR